jgi:hemerythrin
MTLNFSNLLQGNILSGESYQQLIGSTSMQSIALWEPKMKVGNDTIDNQHKVLFDLIKDFKNAITLGASSRTKEVLLGVLLDYFFQHFRTEEEYFNSHADHVRHLLDHYELIKNMNSFIIDFRNSRTDERSPSPDFLENWMIEHIENFDRPVFGTESAKSDFKNKSQQVDEFYSDPNDRRKYKRIPHNEVVNGEIKTDCYNAMYLRSGRATIVNMSPGGLLLDCTLRNMINDLLVVSCSIGSNFQMKEKVKVITVDNHMHGVEFISPSPETIDFLTKIYRAVHLNRAKSKRT